VKLGEKLIGRITHYFSRLSVKSQHTLAKCRKERLAKNYPSSPFFDPISRKKPYQ